MERTNSGVFLLIVYLLLAVYLVPLYPGGRSANELTDWATAVSLVENNTFNIASLEKTAGVSFEPVVSDSTGGKYSTKPPGIAIISAPFYAITRLIVGAPESGNVRTTWHVLRLVISSIPLLILGFWLYNREVDSYSLAALLFATPLFPYSLLYYSHVFVAILVYMAFRMIYDSRRVMPETCFSAAFLLGIALLCEYAAIVPMIVFGIGLLTTGKRDRLRRVIFFTAGILPPLAGLLVYNIFVFNSAFAIFVHSDIAYPTLSTVYTYTLSPSQGLFVFSPVLIFGLLALLGSKEGGMRRHTVKFAAIVLTFIAVCGAGEKYGGASVGPRHMILIMPLLLDSFFDGEIEEYPSHWRGLIFAASFILCTLPVLTYLFAPAELSFPHNSFWGQILFADDLYASTMANTFGLAVSLWTILPAAVLLLIALFLVWRDSKYPVPFAAGLIIGIGLTAAYLFAIPLEPEMAKPFREKAVKIVSVSR